MVKVAVLITAKFEDSEFTSPKEALEGRDTTGYKSIKVDLEYAGATYHDAEVFVCQN